MNRNISKEVVLGKNLNQIDLDLINEYHKIRLNRSSTWDHENNNYFHDRLFFLVRDDNNLVAFGTLRPINIYIDEQEIKIMGIQAVISIVQSKGYGKFLMQEMIRYADNNKQILMGFCEHKNEGFYLKSGFEVFEGKNSNLIFVKENGEEYTEDGDVIYYSSKDNRVKEAILQNIKIIHYIPHW